MPLSDYSLSDFTAGPYTRPVYRRGQGPAVIVIHEVPALHTLVIEFADRLAAAGMTVICPSLFGTPGSVPTKAAAVKQLFLNICIRREFSTWNDGRSSPIVDWLRALAKQAHDECGGPGVGAVGMCFTGGFALAMMSEPSVIAPVLSQPSLPLRGAKAGLIAQHTVAAGVGAVQARLAALRAEGVAYAIADAVCDADLHTLARASQQLALVVAGSGLAIGIPALHGLQPSPQAAQLPPPQGARAVVSGSCSAATQAQVAHFAQNGGAAFALQPLLLAQGVDIAAQALQWALPLLGSKPVLVYATAAPADVLAVQTALGAAAAGAAVEAALARVATGLVQAGVGQLLVAGGETSGACVQALGIQRLRIGPQIDPGVPWCHADLPGMAGQSGLHLALKSGNFGGVDFFSRAFGVLVSNTHHV